MQLMSIKIGLLSVLLLKTCVRKKGGLGGFAPQTLTRSYYFEPPLSKKRSRATGLNLVRVQFSYNRNPYPNLILTKSNPNQTRGLILDVTLWQDSPVDLNVI